jgi:cytochrome c556
LSSKSKIALIIGATASVAGAASTLAAAEPDGASASQIVAARQAAFRLSAGNFGLIKAAAEAGVDPKALAGPAKGLVRWAKTIPAVFPAGTELGVAGSNAKPEIWANRADFDSRAAAYAAAATALAEAAETGDKAAVLEKWKAVGGTCGGCHTAYRFEEKSGH